MNTYSKLLIVSGPGGAGKDTIVGMFRARHPDWQQPPATTSRAPRAGEINGVDYDFVDRSEFEKLARQGTFLEWFEIAGNLYGTPREPVEKLLHAGQNVLFVKDVHGALAIRQAIPTATIVMIAPENLEALARRLRARATDSEEMIVKRLELAKQELTYQNQFDHVIINRTGQSEQALAQLENIAGV